MKQMNPSLHPATRARGDDAAAAPKVTRGGCRLAESMEEYTVGQNKNPYSQLRRHVLEPLASWLCRCYPFSFLHLESLRLPHLSGSFINAYIWAFRMAIAAALASFFPLYPDTAAFLNPGCKFPLTQTLKKEFLSDFAPDVLLGVYGSCLFPCAHVCSHRL